MCPNLNTLTIEGDLRINTDKILSNIFCPEKLENVIFNNVKLPSSKMLKKFTNLKNIELINIRICNLKDFTDGFKNPELIEKIEISNTDMFKSQISNLNKFVNLKHLKLENITNCVYDDFNFLKENNKISQLEILNNQININAMGQILKIKCNKNINVTGIDENGSIIKNCNLKICENKAEVTLPIERQEEICQKVNLYRTDKINIIINSYQNNSSFIHTFKKYKKDMEIFIKDVSAIDLDQLEKLKTTFNLTKVNIQNEDKWKEYNIDTCIEIRKEINNLISNVSKHVSEPEKILEIYRFLGKQINVIEDTESNGDLKNKAWTKKQIAYLLQSCLQCMNIKSNIIFGRDEVNNKRHYWNQVEMDGTWYNLDLGLDCENIKKKKVEYCLLSNETFLETHTPKSGKNNYCPEDFNPKLVNVFFKTGLFKEKLLQSYLEITIERIKKMLNWNKKPKVLALPSGNDEKLKLNP